MRIAIVLLLLIAVDSARADSALKLMKEGEVLYQAGDFEQAGTNFAAAAEAAPPEKLDAAVAKFNQASATLNLGKAGDAARLYAEALHSPDLKLQQRAYFNRGNALLAAAQGMEQEQKLDNAVKAAGEAIQMYESSMALDSKDVDPKVNFELAVKKKMELEEKLKQQQQNQQQNQQEDQKKEEKKDEEQNQQDQKSKDNQEQQKKNDQQQQKEDSKDQEKSENQKNAQDQKSEQQFPPQPSKPEEMTPEEAALLLDAAKQQEQAEREKIQMIMGQPVPVEKDW